MVLIGHFGTNFSEISIEIDTFENIIYEKEQTSMKSKLIHFHSFHTFENIVCEMAALSISVVSFVINDLEFVCDDQGPILL